MTRTRTNRASDVTSIEMAKKRTQAVTAAQEWKSRMTKARSILTEQGIGQKAVLEKVVELKPELDTLTNTTRWRNAWLCNVADTEIIVVVEQVAEYFNKQAKPTKNRLARMGLQKG